MIKFSNPEIDKLSNLNIFLEFLKFNLKASKKFKNFFKNSTKKVRN